VFLIKNWLLNFCSVIFISPLSQYLGILTVTIIYLVLVDIFLPYRHVIANKVEMFAGVSLICAACVLVAISYHKSEGSAATELTATVSIISLSPWALGAISLVIYVTSMKNAGTEQDRMQFLSEVHAISQACNTLRNFRQDQQIAFLKHLTDWDRWYIRQVWHFAVVELLAEKGKQRRTHAGLFKARRLSQDSSTIEAEAQRLSKDSTNIQIQSEGLSKDSAAIQAESDEHPAFKKQESKSLTQSQEDGVVKKYSQRSGADSVASGDEFATLQIKLANAKLLASLAEDTAEISGADMSGPERPWSMKHKIPGTCR